MRKGLITLMTVAIALASIQARAMAPTIGDIPNPVIGDQTAATQPTPFVFQDAFDLNNYVSDPEGTPATSMKWSYEIVGTAKYAINGDQQINSITDMVSSPTLAKTINKTMNSLGVTELNADGVANTITIRNVNLKPFTGTGATPPASGFTDTQPVTFWCSDGSAASSSTVLFYTKIGTQSYLSSRNPWHQMSDNTFPSFPNTGTGKWTVIDGPFGNVTTATWSDGKGICFNVSAAGDNFMSMRSPNPYFTMSANTVYRIRARMNCTATAAGTSPFWDFIIENTFLNLYGQDTYVQDGQGGANAIYSSTPGTWVTMYWAPLAVQTTQWNDTTNGIYKAGFAAQKDPAVRFRVLDVTSNPGVLGAQQAGKICLQELVIESVPLSRVKTVTANVVNITSLAAANAGGTGNVLATNLTGSTTTFTGGVLTVAPATTTAQQAEIVEITPQAQTGTPTGRLYWPSQYPIAWRTGKLYELQVSLAAPDATGAAHPYDAIWLSMESPTWEFTTETYVTSNQGIGSPKTGTPQVYTQFYYSGNETLSGTAELHNLRWRLRFGNAAALLFPTSADTTNTGSVNVSKINVAEVVVQ